MERKQFTFYRSFFDAVSRIRRKSARADVYDAICRYALNGEKPELDSLPSEAAVAITLIMPVLESAMKKALNGALASHQQKSSKPPAKQQQTVCKKEDEKENKKEVKKEREKELDCGAAAPVGVGGDIADFDLFWEAYPKKVGKREAKAAFLKVTVPVKQLLDALEKQRISEQWNREGGRFIPNPATWLGQQRWEDELPPKKGVIYGASGKLGKAELESIQRMLKEN